MISEPSADGSLAAPARRGRNAPRPVSPGADAGSEQGVPEGVEGHQVALQLGRF